MRPKNKSNRLLGVTRSKAKMIEYNVPEKYQNIDLSLNPSKLLTISIGLLGDYAAKISREEISINEISTQNKLLLFSAHFFDSYLQSKLNIELDLYLKLLGASSYYLCDLPGSAIVLVKDIEVTYTLNIGSMEPLILWLLKGDLSRLDIKIDNYFSSYCSSIYNLVIQYFKDGSGTEELFNITKQLRKSSYEIGTPRQLLFSDLIVSIIKKKILNSCWNALPIYSDMPIDRWVDTLQKKSFMKELWPAQHLLGLAGILQGLSAVIQMPTSAGKTKATELIIRSAFLSERTSLSIVVAPFRALCHEIKNQLIISFKNEPPKVEELSDLMQSDFEMHDIFGHQQIIVVTPEKLLYSIRQHPELVSNIGLIIFDECHQFDSGTRGITYELLLTSLRFILPEYTQKILISAVISNAKSVGQWLNGESTVVDGASLNPTFRSIGFVSWQDTLGRIEFVNHQNIEEVEYFVPRIIESIELQKKPRETKKVFFPEKSDGKTIALYLGLKLVPNGSIAIFCGRKATAENICEKIASIIERGIPNTLPDKHSNMDEVDRLHYLHIMNLGKNAPATRSSLYGIFTHHGNTPHGIRLAVEHAMRENLIRFVICTSTLAQGVNLPIRYLLVTSIYQGKEKIKVRDFHNLIGRAGRAGMHTEGSILFADPDIYDKYVYAHEDWRWKQIKALLEPKNSEPCISNLLQLFDPFQSDDGEFYIEMPALEFINAYVAGADKISKFTYNIAKHHKDKKFTREGLVSQITWKISLISSIESFLLSHWAEIESVNIDDAVKALSENTLAFYLANTEKRELIRELFLILAKNISVKVPDSEQRRTYGKTLYGIMDAKNIENWVNANSIDLIFSLTDLELLNTIWPLLIEHTKNSIFKKLNKPEVLNKIAHLWIEGAPFHQLFQIVCECNAKIIWGKKLKNLKIDQMVEICEGGFAYDGALLLGSIIEFLLFSKKESYASIISRLQLFQKKLRYGLPNEAAIVIYELGISDRVIAMDLATTLMLTVATKISVLEVMRSNRKLVSDVLFKYPSFFQERFNSYL